MDDDSAGGGRDGVERLGGLFEDLEQQAAGMHLAERDAELADRARGEYAAVTFASRIHASLAHEVALALVDGHVVEGTLTQAGTDWCRVVKPDGQAVWLVRLEAVAAAYGLSSRAVPEAARPAVARLSFGSAVHRLAEDHDEVLVQIASGTRLRVKVLRIGADFLEVESAGPAESQTVVPFGAVLVVRV